MNKVWRLGCSAKNPVHFCLNGTSLRAFATHVGTFRPSQERPMHRQLTGRLLGEHYLQPCTNLLADVSFQYVEAHIREETIHLDRRFLAIVSWPHDLLPRDDLVGIMPRF